MRSALVLDDDAPLRALIQEALTAQGWTVRAGSRNQGALQTARATQPDLVLLDVSKPDFAPEAIATGLRIHYGPALPILAMATAPEPEVVRRIQAYDFIQKPFELPHLFTLLERGLALSERSARLRADSDMALERIRKLRLLRPERD